MTSERWSTCRHMPLHNHSMCAVTNDHEPHDYTYCRLPLYTTLSKPCPSWMKDLMYMRQSVTAVMHSVKRLTTTPGMPAGIMHGKPRVSLALRSQSDSPRCRVMTFDAS